MSLIVGSLVARKDGAEDMTLIFFGLGPSVVAEPCGCDVLAVAAKHELGKL